MVRVFKRRDFARWQAREKLPDRALCAAVDGLARGLIDADLGAGLYKQRVPRSGQGKRGGYRTFIAARIGTRYVFLHGFPKHERENISERERQVLQFAARVFLRPDATALNTALETGVLLEVWCEQNH
ncbi:type II toxin-antitoxin system RelE/ParE family toxin [Pseudomonadota bacterium AL_CKDN230030165-1A_HGKHYDSX7]